METFPHRQRVRLPRHLLVLAVASPAEVGLGALRQALGGGVLAVRASGVARRSGVHVVRARHELVRLWVEDNGQENEHR